MRKIKNIFINLLGAALLAAGSAGTATAQFSGDFTNPAGAAFDGGDLDYGTGAALYGTSVYTVGISSPAGALAVQYDLAGNVVSSAVLAGVDVFTGVAANPNGVYMTAQGQGSGFVVARYTSDLNLVSSVTLPGDSSARGLAFGLSGDILVVGSNWGEPGSNNDYKIARFSPALVFQSSAVFDAGGLDEGRGIAFDSTYVYITGDSLTGAATNFVTAKLDAFTLAFVSSAAYANGYLGEPYRERLAVNPITHDVYLTGTEGTEANRQMVTVRYSQDLNQLGVSVFPGGLAGLGTDVALGGDGSVYALGKDWDGSYDHALLAKYDPSLVFISSAASQPDALNYIGYALALGPAGDGYVTGLSNDGASQVDMRTVKFPAPAAPTPATQRVWIGGGADLASEAGNWLNGIPVAGDGILMDASFIPNPNLTWDLGSSVPLASVTIQGALPSGAFMVGSPLIVSGDFTLNSPNIAILFNPSGAGSVLQGPVTMGAGIFSVQASTLVAVGSITVNGGVFDLASAYFMGSRVQINSGAAFSMRVADPDFNPEPPLLTSTGPAAALQLVVDGSVDVSSCVLGRLWHKGVDFGLNASFSGFSNVLFQGPLLPGTTAIYFEGGAPSVTFSSVSFADANIYFNVNASLLSAGADIRLLSSSGQKAGEAYENDPGGYVHWGPPVVYISTADISPAFYQAGQEAAALKLTPYTLSGSAAFTGIQIAVNPAGDYANIASVAIYSDTDLNGAWDGQSDEFLAGGAVSSGIFDFNLGGGGGLPAAPRRTPQNFTSAEGGYVNTAQTDLFITITPAAAAVSSNVNVAVLSSNSFTTSGDMAQQAIYPIVSAPRLVNYLAGVTTLSADPGANLGAINLAWTYPQDITAGHYIIRYSTDPADLADPNAAENQTVTPISAVSANDTDSASFYELPVVTEGLRVFPQYFAVWLFNGTSTSTASNLVRNLYFPPASAADQDATLLTRPGMYAQPENAPRFARGPAGAYSALTFYGGAASIVTLNTPYGGSHFYYDPNAQLALKDLAADQDGNAYGFLQRGGDTPLVAKFGPDGAVLWARTFVTPSTETAKALVYGNNAVYAATEYENGSNGRDYKIRKLSAADGTGSVEASYDSAPGAGAYDEVNSLAFSADSAFPAGGYVYAAGASGMYPLNGRLHKFTDTGSVIVPSIVGSWPVQYSSPGGDSRVLVVKEDPNGNVTAAGSEQRYDLNQGQNIWLNRYSPYGGQLFSSRYNNAQANADDVPTGLDFDSFGNIYVSGYTDMWSMSQGYNMLLAKFAPGGQFISARVYDSGSGNYDWGLAVQVSTDNYAHVAGLFGGPYGVYSMPLGSANAQFFTAAEGPFTATVDLTWNYPGQLPAGSTFSVQYSTAAAPVWNRASAQIVVSTGPLPAGSVQARRVGELTALRYPQMGYAGGVAAPESRGNLYKFKVWITSGGLTTELPEAQAFAKTPPAYDNTQYYGRERLSYMSGIGGPGSAIAVDGPYVYHAFGGSSEGASAGFGLRKYNTDQYLEWTKFFNHRLNRGYYVGNMARDAAGNFYLVGSQGAVIFAPEYDSVKNMWIAKLNPDGDLVWSYAVDASGVSKMDELYDVAVEGGSLYVVGVSSNGTDMNAFARKYDISNSTYIVTAPLWTSTQGGSGDDYGYGVAVGTGAVYLSGTRFNADKDIFVRALNKADGSDAGALITIDSGFGDDEGFDLAVTTSTPAVVYVAGSVATSGTANEGTNAALFKYTLSGASVWASYFNGKDGLDDAYYAAAVNGGGVIAAGHQTAGGRGRDAVYRKVTHAGTEEWSRSFDFSYGGDDDAYSLAVDASGRVYSAVALWSDRPGFYYFPEPSFSLMASQNYVPGSVRLDWMNQHDMPASMPFAIQYSTYDLGVAWSTAAAQVRYQSDSAVMAGMNLSRVVYGLDSGRDAQGMSTGPLYYFKVWSSTEAGVYTAVPGAASARASDGWANENMVMYPNEARLFVINSGQQSPAASYGEKEFPGIVRDGSGNVYSLANMDWNGSGGFAVKKFSSAYTPVWTKYYAPGEWFQVKANRMDMDANGDLYVTGSERDPHGSTGRDIFVMKFGASGMVWKTVYDFNGGDDTGYGVAVGGSGNVFVAGSVDAGDGNVDILAAKFSPAGVLLTTVTYSGSPAGYEAGYGVAASGNNVYVTGSSYEPGEASSLWLGRFSATTLTAQGAPVKRSSDSAGGYEEAGYDVVVDSLGYVFTAGALYGADTYSLDAVVIKSSANLAAADWAGSAWYGSQAGGDDVAYGITLGAGAGGNVNVAGYTGRYDINQDKNLWIRKFAHDGSELLTQEFNSSSIPGDYSGGPNSDMGFDLVAGGGNIAVSGKFNGYYGLYRYKQSNTLTVNPLLTVAVSSAACSGCAPSPFAGVGVSLIPYSQTGGIDAASIRSSVTSPSGTAFFQVPAGKQYFIALDKQGYSPNIKDQQMDPYGSYFVQLDADTGRQYTLRPRPANDPYYPLRVTVTSATAGDFIMAEVFFTRTGEKAAYGIAQVPVNRSSVTFTVTNVPPMDAGAYTLGVTIPGRGLSRGIVMDALFPQTSSYAVNMSTSAGAIATTGGFDVGASTTPASVEGVVRSARTKAPLEEVRVRMWNSPQNCSPGSPCMDSNVYETLTDVNGKYSFYNVVSTAAMYNLAAQKSGYRRTGWGVDLSVPNMPTVYREFQLEEATYTLRGVIRYRDIPVPNADVMVWGDYNWYGGSDSYRSGRGLETDARTKTGADGSFVFSTATLNGLPDGQLRMNVAFFGTWVDLNEGNNKSNSMDADDVRIVISSAGAKWNPNSPGNCAPGRAWKLLALSGVCQGSGDVNFNIMPQGQNDYATLSGSVTFVTTYPVTALNPLVISSMTPVTVMAMQECYGDCQNRSLGFAVLSGTYTVNSATYSITLSTGVSYYTRITSSEWGEVSSFDDRADFRSTVTASVVMNFTVTKAGSLKGVVKAPDGSNYKPAYNMLDAQRHSLNIEVRGQNVNVSEGWNVDDYGAFEFPNLAPGLYTVTMRPQGLGFRWAAPVMADVAVVAGKTTQVTLKLEDGLVVQPQIIGLPEISTPTWAYVIIPVESGTEMNQKKVTELFFGKDTFAFNYSTTTRTWDKKVMLTGQYDFYLMLGARYNPENGNNEPLSFDQFGNFIGKVKSLAVQRVESTPNLGTDLQPIPVSILGSLGQDSFEGTILGQRIYTDADLDKIFSNMQELFALIPAVMLYDAAGDLRGYTAGLPTGEDFGAFMDALQTKDKDIVKAYFAAHSSRFMVSGLPPGRYTVVFSNPNYPPIAKELDIPLASSYNGSYPFSFDAQSVRTGDIYGTVRSSATGAGLGDAVVYLKHRTMEKFANTAADGSYSFDNLPQGIYRVEVTREGFVKTGRKTSLTGSLTGDDRANLDFYMTPSQSNMTGKVYLSKFPAPLTKSGVKIVAYDETYNTEHPSAYLPKLEATTNDAGEYELAGVVPGHTYKVSAFYGSKLPATLDVSSETVTEGVTYLPDIVLREVPPQIKVKVRKSPDSVNKVDVTIKSPKQLVSTPVCKVNPGSEHLPATAVSLALVPGPNNTYLGQFTVSNSQAFYNVYVKAGDGSNKMEKSVTYSPNNQAKTEQYIQDEAIKGGEVQMDKESEEYSGIELDTGGLSYSTFSASGVSAYRTSADGDLVGGFFSALPSVRTIKTAKGDLSITAALQDLMASEVYNMELENASANKPFTLTLKYDKEKAADNSDLRIYQYDDATGGWKEVPGDYTIDPMLGVLSVGVASLSDASAGTSGVNTPLGRKRYGMSAVVNGRYVPSAAGTSQSGRFAVFTANPPTGTAAFSSSLQVYNLPNPFSLKSKSVTLSADIGTSGVANPYPTNGTVIKYNLPAGKTGTLKFVIYNMAGEKVRTIDEGSRTGGQLYYSEWDGKNDTNQDCASGVYFMLTYLDGKKLGNKAHKMAIIK